MLQRLIFDLMKTLKKISVLHKSQSALFGWTSLIFGSSGFSPSIRYRNCSSVSSAASCSVLGQVRDPSSKRLYRSRNPSPIQSRPLIRSDLLPQKRKRSSFFKKDFCMVSVTDDHGQSVNAFPQINISAGEYNPADSCCIVKHDGSPGRSCQAGLPKYR
mgnify:CR=1 FL=1